MNECRRRNEKAERHFLELPYFARIYNQPNCNDTFAYTLTHTLDKIGNRVTALNHRKHVQLQML